MAKKDEPRRESFARVAAALSVISIGCATLTAAPGAALDASVPNTTSKATTTRYVWPRWDRVAQPLGTRLYLLKPATGAYHVIADFPREVKSVVASPNGHLLVVLLFDGEVWTSQVGDPSSTKAIHTRGTVLEVWLRRGQVYFTARGQSGEPNTMAKMNTDGTGVQSLQSGSWPVPSSGFGLSPDGRQAAIGDESGIRIVTVSRGRVVRRLHVGAARDVSWARDGRWLLYGTANGVARVHPDGTGRHMILRTITTNHGPINYGAPTWSYNNRHLLTSGIMKAGQSTRLLAANAFTKNPGVQRVPGSRTPAIGGTGAWFRIR